MSSYITNSVADLRLKRSLTQEELAAKVGVSRQTIIALEKGRYTPSVLLALRLAKCFGAQVEDLFAIAYER